jgi:hypothetical protein
MAEQTGNVVAENSKLEHRHKGNVAAKAVINHGYNASTDEYLPLNVDTTGALASGLIPGTYDYISIPSYNANNDPLVVVYKVGGSGGTTVATLTLTYDTNNNITSVART